MRHATDLGYIPVVVADACGFGDVDAAQPALAGLAYAGDALQADSAQVVEAFRRFETNSSLAAMGV